MPQSEGSTVRVIALLVAASAAGCSQAVATPNEAPDAMAVEAGAIDATVDSGLLDASGSDVVVQDVTLTDSNAKDVTLPPIDASPEASCNTSFTSHVTDTTSLHSVSPLPALAGGAGFEIRSYMTVKAGLEGTKIPIYAPTRMKIVGAKHYLLAGTPPGYVADWSLEFTSTCEPDVQIGFAHVKDVSPAVAAVTDPTLSPSSAVDPVSQQAIFEPGDVIGYYIKGINSIAWDYIVRDARVVNQFVNQSRYAGNKLLNAICPYEKMVPAIQNAYLALLAGPGQTPGDAGMKCGTVMHDKIGTIAGLWFLDQNADAGVYGGMSNGVYDSPNAAFLGEDKVVHLAGFNRGSVRIEPGNPTYVDPKTVTTTHCYQIYPTPSNGVGYIYYQVVSNTEMRIAYSSTGSCPTSMPSVYQTYYR